MNTHPGTLGFLFVALALLAPPLHAEENGYHWKDDQIAGTLSYQRFHPDQQHRALAVQAYNEQDYAAAHKHFLRAAHYGDKASQAAIAEMMWRGIGVEQNRPQAYAWMDAAAERGYKSFLVHRERYWAQLSEDERQQAVKFGAQVYAGFGDAVAKPRMERVLRMGDKWAYASVTHKAYARTSVKNASGHGFTTFVAGYYDPKYWEPQHYWKWQEKIWDEPKSGTVSIGPLEVGVDAAPTAEADK